MFTVIYMAENKDIRIIQYIYKSPKLDKSLSKIASNPRDKSLSILAQRAGQWLDWINFSLPRPRIAVVVPMGPGGGEVPVRHRSRRGNLICPICRLSRKIERL